MEQSLLLQLGVVAQEQIRLTVKDLTRQLGILVEVDLACGESRVNANHTVKCHYWVWSEHEVLGVALLTFVWIEEHILLVKSQLSLLGHIL